MRLTAQMGIIKPCFIHACGIMRFISDYHVRASKCKCRVRQCSLDQLTGAGGCAQTDTEGPCDAVNCDLVTAQGLGMRPLHCDMMIPLLLVFNLFICNGVPFYLVYIYANL